MEVRKLTSFKGGWFIGDFEPSILKTSNFELAIHHYRAGELWDVHTHYIATEYNVLISGSMTVCEKTLESGDVFIIHPFEISAPIYHTDCIVVICKVPSIIGDKYNV
jgi:hypothetical protein